MKSFYHRNATRAKYYAINRWMKFSCVTIISCLSIISLLYLPEYLLHKELVLQHKELHAHQLINTKKMPEAAPFQLALSKIQARQKKAHEPVTLLKKIKDLCTNDSTLESLSLKKHDLQITMAAKNAPALITLADHLAQQSPWADLHINALEPKEQRMIATIKSHKETKNS